MEKECECYEEEVQPCNIILFGLVNIIIACFLEVHLVYSSIINILLVALVAVPVNTVLLKENCVYLSSI